MKKHVIFLISLFLISSVFVMDSCKDDRVRGCTDPNSINFEPLAERSDGSCEYEGQIVIWYDEEASAGLTQDGATALTFYLNGDVIGSSAASVFWPNPPECGDNGSITATEYLGRNKSQQFNLSVVDQDGIEYWNTALTLEGNTCLIFELSWDKRKK